MKIPKFLYVILIIICILLAANLWMARYQIQVSSPCVTLLNRWTGQVYISVGTDGFEPLGKWTKPPVDEPIHFTPIEK